MTSSAGWYPDPAGHSDQLRYWDGRSWSASTRPVPARSGSAGPPPEKKSRRGWIFGALVVVVVAIVVIAFGVRALSTRTADSPASSGGPSVTVPTATDRGPGPLSCGERSPDFDPAPTGSGMVRSGWLSYPELTAPFDGPTRTTLLPFDYLRDVAPSSPSSDTRGAPPVGPR